MTEKPMTLPVGLPGTFTTTGWEPPDKALDPDAWEHAFTRVVEIGKSNPWHKGDLLRYGEARYGERYAQAVDAWMMAYGSLANYASVCDRFPPDRRRAELSFSHHQEVAYINKKETDWILDAAVEHGLNVRDVRKIKQRYLDSMRSGPPSSPGILISLPELQKAIETQIYEKRERALTVPDPSLEPDPSSDDLTARREGEGWPDLARRLTRWYWGWRRRAEHLEAENARLRSEMEELRDALAGSLDPAVYEPSVRSRDWKDAL